MRDIVVNNDTAETHEVSLEPAVKPFRPKPIPPRSIATFRLAQGWIATESAQPAVPSLSDLGWLDRLCAAEPAQTAPIYGTMLTEALARLDPQSRDIVIARRLSDAPADLRSLAASLDLSPHRVATIEQRAHDAIRDWMHASVIARRATATADTA